MSDRRDLVLFDVDGTLAQSGKQCSTAIVAMLQRLAKVDNIDLGVIDSNSLETIRWQLSAGGAALRWLFAENGLMTGDGTIHDSFDHAVGKEDQQHVIDLCLHWIANTRLPFKRDHVIELGVAIMHVTPIGWQCSAAERDRFSRLDSTHGFRLKLLRHLRADKQFAAALQCCMDNHIGIDIYPAGFDKTYCWRHIAAADMQYNRIYYINSGQARSSGAHLVGSPSNIQALESSGPQHTLQLIDQQLVPRLVASEK